MSNPKFDTQNPFFKNKYASLAAVRDAVIPVLARNGISVVQDLQTAEGAVACSTILCHSSGQQMRFGPYTLPVSKQDAQGYGSASTYARRYHLMAVAGVVGDSDDDAESAVGRGTNDPRGEAHKSADMKKAKEYAERFRQALSDGKDELMYELHQELNPEADFYIAVSTFLSAAERRSIKESIKAVHEAHKANGTRQ
jgi:hypothetical protein